MTDPNIAAMETAARLYLNAIGEDPDELVPAPGKLFGVPAMKPKWEAAAGELLDLRLMLGALNAAAKLEQAQPPH